MRELVKEKLRQIKKDYEDVPPEHSPLGRYHEDLEKFLIYATDKQLLPPRYRQAAKK